MINYDNVMEKADKYYAEIKSEKLQCDISLVPQQIQSDQIRALAKALVEEINGTFECDTINEFTIDWDAWRKELDHLDKK
jgi:hypothetical protein